MGYYKRCYFQILPVITTFEALQIKENNYISINCNRLDKSRQIKYHLSISHDS